MSPGTFKCGHERSPENTRVNGRNRECRTCYRSWENAYRKRTNRKEYEAARYRRNLLKTAAAAKPHLYKQAAPNAMIRTRRHHQLLREAWATAEAWAETNRAALRQALAASMSPAERREFDRHAVRVQARRATAFLN